MAEAGPEHLDDGATESMLAASDVEVAGQREQDEDMASLPPDHPLLRRAQEALSQQLEAAKLQLEEKLQERRKELKDAKQQREDVGVELYGYQQHLAKLQLSLERTGDDLTGAAQERTQTDAELAQQKAAAAEAQAAKVAAQAQTEALQGELEGLSGMLRQVERNHDKVASRIAVTTRETYAAEEAVQKLEKAKQEQDFLVDSLQQQLATVGRQAELHTAQLAAQRVETQSAREVLARAVADMEGVQYEKRALVGQWKASLAAMARRDEALKKLQAELQHVAEAQEAARQELGGYVRDTAEEKQRGDQHAEVLKKLEGQSAYLAGRVAKVQQRQAELAAAHVATQGQLVESERQLATAKQEGAKLAGERAALERQQGRLAAEAHDAAAQALERLGQQAGAERGAAQTLRDVKALRAAVVQKEASMTELQAAVDAAKDKAQATAARNHGLAASLEQLDKVVADKAAGVAAVEAELKARAAEIEAKARELDVLNRRLLRIMESKHDVETGPLEATIANLQRETGATNAASTELQRRWVGLQGRLVDLQGANASLASDLAGLRSQRAVMAARQDRLRRSLDAQQAEGKALAKALAGMHAEVVRLNGQLADATGLRGTLSEEASLLEARISGELRELEARWAALKSSSEGLRSEKAEALAALVEVERQVLVAERRVQLERELQDAIDPAYGSAEVQALRKDVNRLRHRQAELQRRQEALVGELERAVVKREVIGTRGRAAQAPHARAATEAQLRKQAAELERGAAAAVRDQAAALALVAEVEEERASIAAVAQAAAEACSVLQHEGEETRVQVEELGVEKHKSLVGTAAKQREARLLEEVDEGKYKLRVADPSQLAAEAERALRKQQRIAKAVHGVAAEAPAPAARALACALAYATAAE